MSELIRVSTQDCHFDGLCVKACPIGVLTMKGPHDVPSVIPGREGWCIRCGHCESVCPHGALKLQWLALEPEKETTSEKPALTPAQIRQHFIGRRSIRHFSEKPVPRETLEELLDIARYAPSAKNGQPVRWLVIHDTRELRRLTGIAVEWMKTMVAENAPMAKVMMFPALVAAWEKNVDLICRHAPHLILAYGDQKNKMFPGDAMIALTYLELAAPSFGLGSCWAGFFQIAASLCRPLQDALGLPPGHATQSGLMLGFPAVKYFRIPRRNPAKIIWK
jgi:nitroreductase/NAD-dependent dihydropyrimidine dehydrogenase PreA subunit